MAERYVKQSVFTNPVYSRECPVALEKGALLFDTKKNSYLLQLKFANIGTTRITSVYICVEANDTMGISPYPEIHNQYMEFAAAGESFGTKVLIPLPTNEATTFKVYVEKVTTIDGHTHTFTREHYEENTKLNDITSKLEEQAITAKKMQIEAIDAKQENAKWGRHRAIAVLVVNTIVLLTLTIAFIAPPIVAVAVFILVFIALFACVFFMGRIYPHLFANKSAGVTAE